MTQLQKVSNHLELIKPDPRHHAAAVLPKQVPKQEPLRMRQEPSCVWQPVSCGSQPSITSLVSPPQYHQPSITSLVSPA